MGTVSPSPSRRADARRRTVAQLRERFGWTGPSSPRRRSALVLLSGLPGTGKSYLAESLAVRFGLIVLRSDEVRKALVSNPRYTGHENGRVYLTCYALIESLLADGYAIVFDATNLMRRGRRRAQKLAASLGAAYLQIVTTSPPDVVAERLRLRAAGETAAYSSDADWEVHEKLAGTMQAIVGASEPALVLDTSTGLEPAFDAVEELLR